MTIRAKTFTYTTSLRWDGEKRGTMSAEGKPDVQVATPPEFKGHEGIWSPEDLYISSANICVMTTFLAFAERAGLRFESYQSEAEGTLDFVENRFLFTKIVLRPRITLADGEDKAKAGEILEKAERNCLISASMKAEVVLEPTIESA